MGTQKNARDQRASLLRAVMNELKRDEKSAALELAIPERSIVSALSGDPTALDLVLAAVTQQWPVSPFALVAPKSEPPIKIFSGKNSKASSRIIQRKDIDYYEYRDTATTSISPIRPEWIRMLVDEPTCNPESSGLSWNHGHALHQLTYFLGSVNFYWELGGQRFGQQMTAGDVAYIPSWVPHTFARPIASASSAIMAVTFRGAMTFEAVQDLRSSCASIDGRSKLARLMTDASLTPEMLHILSGITAPRVRQLMKCEGTMSPSEARDIASALTISEDDLKEPENTAKVIIRRNENRNRISSLGITREVIWDQNEIASSTAFIFEIEPFTRFLCNDVHLHQFVYVLHGEGLTVKWADTEKLLSAGDSICASPAVDTEWISSASGARILCFRCTGAYGVDARTELESLGPHAIERYGMNQSRWYD